MCGEGVCGALDAASELQDDVGVDHRCAEVFVAEQALDGADVVAVLQEAGGEGVTEGVARSVFGDGGAAYGAGGIGRINGLFGSRGG